MISDLPRWSVEKGVDQVRFLDPLPNETGVQVKPVTLEYIRSTIQPETISKCYTYSEEDDRSFSMEQYAHIKNDKELFFGPLKTTINQLIDMGFHLEISGFKYQRHFKLVLRRDREQYSILKLNADQLHAHGDLGWHIKKDNLKLHFFCPKHEMLKPVVKYIEKIKEVEVGDPLEQLRVKYPKRHKKVEFIGNQTLSEYVKTQLKIQRSTI